MTGSFRGGNIPPNPAPNTDNFLEVVHRAIAESVKRQIEADTIILSPYIGFSVYRAMDGRDHPMICGMNVVISNELPACIDFALIKSGKDDELEYLRTENYRLRDRLAAVENAMKEE